MLVIGAMALAGWVLLTATGFAPVAPCRRLSRIRSNGTGFGGIDARAAWIF